MSDNLPERRPDRYLTHADVDLMFRIAKAYSLSKFWEDVDAEAKAFVIISAGRELGLMPFQSLQFIDVIKGKPVLNSQFFAVMIKEHEHYDYHVVEISNERCEIHFLRDGEILGTSTFDQEDAKQAQLLGSKGQMYEKYPRNMLFARALSNGAAWFMPDVIGVRAYVEGELEDDYLATKSEREAKRAAERLALEQAKAAVAGTAPPAPPVEPGEHVVDVTPEEAPEMGTAVQEPMTGTASATLDPVERMAEERVDTAVDGMQPDPVTAAAEDAPEPRERTAAEILADRKAAGKTQAEAPNLAAATAEQQARLDAEKPALDARAAELEAKPKRQRAAAAPKTKTPEEILALQEENIALVRKLVIEGVQGADRKNCHESMKFLGMWGEDAPRQLWLAFGKKALSWDTLEPAFNEAIEAELLRQAAEAEAQTAAEAAEEPPFGGEEEQVVDVEPEPAAPPWGEPEAPA